MRQRDRQTHTHTHTQRGVEGVRLRLRGLIIIYFLRMLGCVALTDDRTEAFFLFFVADASPGGTPPGSIASHAFDAGSKAQTSLQACPACPPNIQSRPALRWERERERETRNGEVYD